MALTLTGDFVRQRQHRPSPPSRRHPHGTPPSPHDDANGRHLRRRSSQQCPSPSMTQTIAVKPHVRCHDHRRTTACVDRPRRHCRPSLLR
ncbi:hypothetical protein U1Q18_003549 [Sarracenia purpurea var. burkii]